MYWVPPPTARDPEFNDIYASQNRAAERAADAIFRACAMDIYSTLNHGRYSDTLKIDGSACSRASRTACTSRARPWRRYALSSPRWQRTSPRFAGDETRAGSAGGRAGAGAAGVCGGAELLVNGDSLAEGTRPFILPELPDGGSRSPRR